jgi:hypothetical protein
MSISNSQEQAKNPYKIVRSLTSQPKPQNRSLLRLLILYCGAVAEDKNPRKLGENGHPPHVIRTSSARPPQIFKRKIFRNYTVINYLW